jgi:hypothetical protein
VARQGAIRLARFAHQHVKGRYVVVPLDERRHTSRPCEGLFVQGPHNGFDWTSMRVDQEMIAYVVAFLGETGEVTREAAQERRRSRDSAWRLPIRSPEIMTVAQVPFGTTFQALP